MTMSVVCIPGAHTVEVEDEEEGVALALPTGWLPVRAAVIPDPNNDEAGWNPGVWYADDSSETTIFVCPEHAALVLNDRPLPDEADAPPTPVNERDQWWTDRWSDYLFPFHQMFRFGWGDNPPV